MDCFLEEMLSQPRILRAILDRYLEDEALLRPLSGLLDRRDLTVMAGMGSSQYAFYPACIYLNERGWPAFVVEASELLHYCRGFISDRVLVWLASQSGETIEVKRLLDEIGGKALTLCVTNEAESYAAANSDLPILLHAGPEEGPASKTYTSALAVLLLCAMTLTTGVDRQRARRLYAAVEAMEHFLERWEEEMDRLVDFLGPVDALFLLGRGPSVASVRAGSLMLKETAKVRAEGMSAGQFRHGPLELASPGFAAIVFAAHGKTQAFNLRLASDIAEFGGKVVVIGSGEVPRQERMLVLELPVLGELYAPIAEIVPVQLFSHRLAIERGLPPGKFERAGKVTRRE